MVFVIQLDVYKAFAIRLDKLIAGDIPCRFSYKSSAGQEVTIQVSQQWAAGALSDTRFKEIRGRPFPTLDNGFILRVS